jgi:N-carbamoylputrescine amidase
VKLTLAPAAAPLSRVKDADRSPVRVALVQTRWHESPEEHLEKLNDGIALAAEAGASIVFLQELTLSRYPADTRPTGIPNELAEPLADGPTYRFAAAAASKHSVIVHASLYEHQPFADGRGLNTAIMVHPNGTLIARTPKLHIPVTAGYYEDEYFQPGPALGEPYPVYTTDLSGAEILAYPTAIGSEPDHPDFDTEPLWRSVIVGNGIANGTFMVVPNRWGNEGALNFYGSSFISDPYGRILARAAREGDEVLVADLDLDQRRDWLDLFPFLATRRPDTYSKLIEPVSNPRSDNGDGVEGGIAGVGK